MRWHIAFCVLALISAGSSAQLRGNPPSTSDPVPPGARLVATGQTIRPAGDSLEFVGRPVDLSLSPDGKTLYAKHHKGLAVVDVPAWTLRQHVPLLGGGASPHGIAIRRDGSRLYVTSSTCLNEFTIHPDGSLAAPRPIALANTRNKNPFPCGIALSPDEQSACVCLSINNTLAIVDLPTGKVLRQIPVGIAPYAVILSPDATKAYVSNWGGRRPVAAEPTASSADDQVLVDAHGIPCSGTVSVIDLKQNKELTQIPVGLHPSALALTRDGARLFVANANSDSLSVISTANACVLATLSLRPQPNLPFGSMCNALALAPDGKTLFVANGGNNAVAVVTGIQSDPPSPAVAGFIPAGWYPAAVLCNANTLFIANAKGTGKPQADPRTGAFNTHASLGSLSKVSLPDPVLLKQYTQQVLADALIPQSLRAMERRAPGQHLVPVPHAPAQASLFQHVVYIVKENRTYDQVFGDLPRGNRDEKLCTFPRPVTPNLHALAEQFVLLDNFYCNGVRSIDGHYWATSGAVTDYLEKSFGGFARGGDEGYDALQFPPTGFIWDKILLAGLSFRNYGEFAHGKPTAKSSWSDLYADHLAPARRIKFDLNIGLEPLRPYTCPDYPGWNLSIPDALRADIFLDEFRANIKSNQWQNFTVLYLPQDHTSGTSAGAPHPASMVADNDLAVGRVVDAISHSPFWKDTCIFIIEDDPQNGYDHVDGHRSICLVISPYTKRRQTVSQFYNQTSVLHTIEAIFNLAPMTQFDSAAPLMIDCFTDTPDPAPYTVLPNQVPLDQLNHAKASLTGQALHFALLSEKQDYSVPDRINDDDLNRILWHSAKGDALPYPADLAGPHGKGLKPLHLQLMQNTADPD